MRGNVGEGSGHRGRRCHRRWGAGRESPGAPFPEHGIPHKVLERGKVAQSWRDMRPGMVLLSPGVPGTDWTSLTLEHPIWSFPGVRAALPDPEDFLCYVECLGARSARRGHGATERLSARADAGGISVTVSGGVEIPCRFLVIATGAPPCPVTRRSPGSPGTARAPLE